MATFHCTDCDKTLKKSNMRRHAHEVHGEGTPSLVYCDMCEYASNRQRDLERHTYRTHHQNKWPTPETDKKRTATSQADPNRKRLIVKLPKPKATDEREAGSATATSEDEETRRRALYKIPLIKNRDPHDTMADFSREGSVSRDESAPTHQQDPPQQSGGPPQPPRTHHAAQGSLRPNPPEPEQSPAPAQARSERHRSKSTTKSGKRSASIGMATDPLATSNVETQTTAEKRRINIEQYRDRSTHNVEITYSRDSTKVVVQNATGEWRTTRRDLNTLMADQIPNRNPVDINLRLDPYQTSTSTSFDNDAWYGLRDDKPTPRPTYAHFPTGPCRSPCTPGSAPIRPRLPRLKQLPKQV